LLSEVRRFGAGVNRLGFSLGVAHKAKMLFYEFSLLLGLDLKWTYNLFQLTPKRAADG
jgi:hypothetical protein